MKITKALKKEKKSIRNFFIIMILLFIFLPIITFLSQINSLFLVGYLLFIEILIVIALINKLNYHNLKFSCTNNKLKFKSGIFTRESTILCDKIVVVHTYKEKEDMEIIIMSTVKFRNKYLRPVSKGFLKKFPEASNEYLRIKKLEPEESYYFQIIRKGALKKYILLDTIYKNCVKASYTASAIENIKIAREQIEIY